MSDMNIAEITVGERRREDFGDIDGLAANIAKRGLLHPIVVDGAGNLVAGERRLRACQLLGWTDVPTRDLGDLTEAERQEIELEENLHRKDLTPYERAKTLAERAGAAAVVLREQADSLAESANESPRKRGGQPKSDAETKIAERIGVPQKTINAARHHVETAESFPVFQAPGWKQYHVLEARECLDKFGNGDRVKAVAIIDQPDMPIPPQAAIPILRNLAAMPDEQRGEVFRLNESGDKRERSLALTMAADRPPMPDPRLVPLRSMLRDLRAMARSYPDDPHTPKVQSVAECLGDLVRAVQEGVRDANGRR